MSRFSALVLETVYEKVHQGSLLVQFLQLNLLNRISTKATYQSMGKILMKSQPAFN